MTMHLLNGAAGRINAMFFSNHLQSQIKMYLLYSLELATSK